MSLDLKGDTRCTWCCYHGVFYGEINECRLRAPNRPPRRVCSKHLIFVTHAFSLRMSHFFFVWSQTQTMECLDYKFSSRYSRGRICGSGGRTAVVAFQESSIFSFSFLFLGHTKKLFTLFFFTHNVSSVEFQGIPTKKHAIARKYPAKFSAKTLFPLHLSGRVYSETKVPRLHS